MILRQKTQTTTLPASVEAHPNWVKHEQRIGELATSLTSAQDTLAQLVAEQQRLQVEQQEHAVRMLLGDPMPAGDTSIRVTARLAELDGEIARARARENAVREALRRLEALGGEVRGAIENELREQIQREGTVVIGRMAAALIDVMTCNQELRRLEAFQLATLPVPSWQEFGSEDWCKARTWLAQARAAGLDV